MAELQNKETLILLTLNDVDDKNKEQNTAYAIEFEEGVLNEKAVNEIVKSLKQINSIRHLKFFYDYKIEKVNKIDKERVKTVPREFVEFVANKKLYEKYSILPVIVKRVIDSRMTAISCHSCLTTLIYAEENGGKYRVLETQSCKHYVAREYGIKNKEDKKTFFEKLTSNDSKIVMMISENDRITTIELWDWE